MEWNGSFCSVPAVSYSWWGGGCWYWLLTLVRSLFSERVVTARLGGIGNLEVIESKPLLQSVKCGKQKILHCVCVTECSAFTILLNQHKREDGRLASTVHCTSIILLTTKHCSSKGQPVVLDLCTLYSSRAASCLVSSIYFAGCEGHY